MDRSTFAGLALAAVCGQLQPFSLLRSGGNLSNTKNSQDDDNCMMLRLLLTGRGGVSVGDQEAVCDVARRESDQVQSKDGSQGHPKAAGTQ